MPLTWSNEQGEGPLPRRKNGSNSNQSINMQIQEAKAAGKNLLAENLRAQRNSRKGYNALKNTTPNKPFWKKCTNALTCSSTPVNNNALLYGSLPKVPTPNATTPSALKKTSQPVAPVIRNGVLQPNHRLSTSVIYNNFGGSRKRGGSSKKCGSSKKRSGSTRKMRRV